MKYIIVTYIIWNIITFLMMGIDKHKAKNNKWRISEATLLISAFAMGGIGTIMGSHIYRHKTQKNKFKILLPLAVLVNWTIIYLVLVKLKEMPMFS
jgi:uncharacterized membrane protein YsdA (DUF1294 family)